MMIYDDLPIKNGLFPKKPQLRPPAAAVPRARDGPLGTRHRAHGAPRGAPGARGARGGAGAARGPSRDDAPGTSSWKP